MNIKACKNNICASKRLLAFACLSIGFTTNATVLNDSEPMTFSIRYPCSGVFRFDCAPYIYAKGTITRNTPSNLARFLQKPNITGGMRVFFQSPGGDLVGGLRLGKVIRAARLDTYVGTDLDGFGSGYLDYGLGDWREDLNRVPIVLTRKAYCFSACAFAFLGGVNRLIGPGAEYGVHQFKSVRASP